TQPFSRLLEGGDIAAGEVEPDALGGERTRDRKADALACPGDQGALARELQIHFRASFGRHAPASPRQSGSPDLRPSILPELAQARVPLASTSFRPTRIKDVDGRDEPGHDDTLNASRCRRRRRSSAR